MRKFVILLIVATAALTSCRKDFDTVTSNGGLIFSKNTVYLDTIFTDISSSTYMLKVYNTSKNDINIPRLQLGKGLESKYRIMVDGMTGNNGKIFDNVQLLAKDSLFIFIETTANIGDTEPDFTYNDEIQFNAGSANQQNVKLVTLIQDAVFIKPDRQLPNNIKETLQINGQQSEIEGHSLMTDAALHWTNEKPYVVYGFAFVPSGKTLVIDAGARAHFHKDSGIIVDVGGKIEINGAVSTYDGDGNVVVNNEVNFEGDRLEPSYSEIPGQWLGVLVLSNLDNRMNHLTLKNSIAGLYVQRLEPTAQATVTITNSQIFNSLNFGIYSRAGKIIAENVAINYCGEANAALTLGGDYSFTHCTFNNNFNSSKQVAVLINNYEETETTIEVYDLTNASFKNCIIYGSNQVELFLDKVEANAQFNYEFRNCLIKFNNANLQTGSNLYNFDSDATHYSNILRNQNPRFANIFRNQLYIPLDSPAAGAGGNFTTIFNYDYFQNPRPMPLPDLGAFNAIEFP